MQEKFYCQNHKNPVEVLVDMKYCPDCGEELDWPKIRHGEPYNGVVTTAVYPIDYFTRKM